MLRVSDGSGASVALELWEVPPAGLALILQREPPGLSIGCVLLSDTRVTLGVLGEPFLVESQREITAFGGWRAYTASLSSSLSAPPTLGCVTLPAACPYPFSFPLQSTALIMVDMQLDFCSSGGFGAALGNDVSQLRGASHWTVHRSRHFETNNPRGRLHTVGSRPPDSSSRLQAAGCAHAGVARARPERLPLLQAHQRATQRGFAHRRRCRRRHGAHPHPRRAWQRAAARAGAAGG